MSDGVGLKSASHPRPRGLARVYWWFRSLMPIRRRRLKTVEIDWEEALRRAGDEGKGLVLRRRKNDHDDDDR
jgi:hypothetical protein